MSEEEAPAGGEESPGGEAAAPPPEATTPEPVDTTTAGARMLMHHPWMTAAAVALYATRVMWVKFRELGLAKQKKRLKDQQAKSKSLKDDVEDVSDTDEDDEEDDDEPAGQSIEEVNVGMLPNPALIDDLDMSHRRIEVPIANI
ncbi:uncharacterized protein LOC108093618 [Drosophila ficusphila]|uniref:uncharacterized protein LOC108093618 n=1 Tax=Drosophila ficusphila TaxID=30025 RepID=UPI0007E6E8D6|nr:uncharacterized protein LOC108093618 [Drosophila ficusphila]